MRHSRSRHAARLLSCVALLLCITMGLAADAALTAAEKAMADLAAASKGSSTLSSDAPQQPAAANPNISNPALKNSNAANRRSSSAKGASGSSLPRPLMMNMDSTTDQTSAADAPAPVLRQAPTGPGLTGSTLNAGSRVPPAGPEADTTGLLPFCDPRRGVICTNTDRPFQFLKAVADPITYTGTPFVEVGTSGSAALNDQTTVNGFGGTLGSTLSATTSTAVTSPNVLARTGLNAATNTQTVLGGVAVDASTLGRVLPNSVSTAAGATNVRGTYESIDYVPRFTYLIGANFGLPFGLATNARK